MSMSAITPRKLPIFVFPQSITFYLDDQSTHKQVLTLYNPYEFPVKFKVLSTAPYKYQVVDPEGVIKASSCVDIVVRHTAVLATNCNVIDKFRIQMYEYPNKQIIGKRDVEAKLLPGIMDTAGRATPDPDIFQQLPINENKQQETYALISRNKTMDLTIMNLSSNKLLLHVNGALGGTNHVALIAGIICIIGLLLPTEGEQNHRLPDYLHLSVNFKLIFSFVLGMVANIVLGL
ncbi:motile sperm domain-containing protein 1 isoform X1 [Solenopsis invicta]|uniref:motile sperm domain-containing protein 1 isoform X1 n=1 Tax=Solenopsis invicta TaxID=13686 RepID=UPI0001FEA59D|nr:motile sperm domain-containing protein 1 isoform X1 [Solenopsis invicta]XP_011173501.1 motile sperm domain-containing protein 1 isoform X1 [Solenopsis invicta]XP_011173502.1 motile sperm domain-containing protein 1 isoform X1 [Solenopsis invicta]XP_011173503.1 motile sperm domain-containing protein 1 isoform X1 [Solenopsis invicta]